MTTGSTSNHHHALHPRDDRETLSALFDGELAADAMRFALKRLDRDVGWRDTCGRWQLIGDALRGEAAVAAPLDFASGVMRTLAAESHAAQAAAPVSTQAAQVTLSSAQGGSRRRWVGGAALAASIAMATVLVVRPFSDSDPSSPGSGAQVAAGVVAPTAAQATASLPGQTVAPASNTPASASAGDGSPMAAVAVADARPPAPVPRAARSGRVAPQPISNAITPPSGETAVVANAVTATGRQPFHPPADDIVTRPWPRAVLSGNAAAGALTVDFGSGSASPSFYPFEPRLPSQDPASDPQAPEPQR